MTLLDPRFKYIPADATDVAATWQRFGFNAQENERRRAKRQDSNPLALPSQAQLLQELLLRVAAARLTV
jgi:hypothetical protein